MVIRKFLVTTYLIIFQWVCRNITFVKIITKVIWVGSRLTQIISQLLHFTVTTQVDRLKTDRKKRILRPCLMQESHSAKVRQSYFSDPFSLQPKQLQPDYVSSYTLRCFKRRLRAGWLIPKKRHAIDWLPLARSIASRTSC